MAFLAPEIATVPCNRRPPSMMNLAIGYKDSRRKFVNSVRGATIDVAEIILLEPDPGYTGVGKRSNTLLADVCSCFT